MTKKEASTFLQYASVQHLPQGQAVARQARGPVPKRPIVESPPSASELTRLVKQSGLPIRKWFNTSGQSYRALIARIGKEGLAKLDDAAKIKLLAADGKMIERPVLVAGTRCSSGSTSRRTVHSRASR